MPDRTGRSASADTFQAIADENRRTLLVHLTGGERSVNDLASEFEITRSAVSQHLRILLDAGLVHVRKEGRTRYYRLSPMRLLEVVDWLAHFDRFWDEKLEALRAYMERPRQLR